MVCGVENELACSAGDVVACEFRPSRTKFGIFSNNGQYFLVFFLVGVLSLPRGMTVVISEVKPSLFNFLPQTSTGSISSYNRRFATETCIADELIFSLFTLRGVTVIFFGVGRPEAMLNGSDERFLADCLNNLKDNEAGLLRRAIANLALGERTEVFA